MIAFLEKYLQVRTKTQARVKTVLISLVIAYTAVFASALVFRIFMPQVYDALGYPPYVVAFSIALTLAFLFLSAFMSVALKLNEANRSLEKLARHDSLTGLLNRRAFFEELELRQRKRGRKNRGNWLLLLDADHFKVVNDTHGHSAGDLVLTMIAMVLRGNAFERDLIARIGGEEFAIYLHDTNAEGAYRAAERIRNAVEENTVYFESNRIKVTVSVGGACVCGLEPVAETLTRADVQLYRSKAGGRNRSSFDEAEIGENLAQKPAIRLVSTS